MAADQESDRETWLRNNFHFAYVTQFLNFFYPAFGLDSFTYHDLESLFLEEPDHITGETTNFFKKILKTLPNVRINLTDNWIDALTKEYRKRGYEIPYQVDSEDGGTKKSEMADAANEEQEKDEDDQQDTDGNQTKSSGPTFESFDLEMKLQILFDLCNFHHENPVFFVEHLLKGYDEGSNWRLEVLGKDSHQMAYWLFEDGRLYREKVDKANLPVDTESWELVCHNRKTWDEFLANGLSNKPGDRRLKEALEAKKKTIADALEIEEAYEACKAKVLAQAAHKAFYDSLPRKRSSRLQEKDAKRQQMLAELAAQEEEERRYQAELHQSRTGVLPPVKKQAPAGADPITHGLSREERAELRRKKIEQEANAKLLKELEEKQAEAEKERLKNEAQAEVDVVGDVQQSPKIKLIIRQPTKPAAETKNGGNGRKGSANGQTVQQQQKPTPSPELIQYLYQMQQRQLQLQQQHQQQQQQHQQQLQQQQQRHLQMHQLQQQHQAQMGQPQHYQYQNQNQHYQMQYQYPQQYPMVNNPVQIAQQRIPMTKPQYPQHQQQSMMMAPQGQFYAPNYQNHQIYGNANYPPGPQYQFHHSMYTQPRPMPVSQIPPVSQSAVSPPTVSRSMDSLLNAVSSQEPADARTSAIPNPPTMEQ